MNRRSLILILTSAIGAVLLTLMFALPNSTTAGEDVVSARTDSGGNRNSAQNATNTRTSRLRKMKNKLAVFRKPKAESPPAANSQPTPEDYKREYEISVLQREKGFRVLDEMLAEQNKDLEWEARVEEEAEEQLKDEKYAGTTLENMTCGMKLCKMVLVHESNSARDQLVNGDFAESGSWDGDQHGRTVTREDGTPITQIFFTRHGDYEPFIELHERLAILAGYEPISQYAHLPR